MGVVKNLKKPSQTSRGVPVGLKVGFTPHKEYRLVPKRATASSISNKKKDVEPTNEVSNSNPFDVLNTVDNDIEFGTNGGLQISGNKGANSSGFSFWNVKNSSTCTTPIIDKIRKYEILIIDGQAILVDEAGNPLKKAEYPVIMIVKMRLHQLIMIWLIPWLQKGLALAHKVCWNTRGILMEMVTMMTTHTMMIFIKVTIFLKSFKLMR
nr:hypothetical protein [Tanacetum cinerariifolium]